jgi:glutaredoxin-related protein
MPRPILDESHIHPSVRERVATLHLDIIDEVQAAVHTHPVVVVGMRANPFPRKARRLLQEAGIAYRYLEYGGYLSQWRRRNALKVWTGWPTFPMIFVKGVLIGGYEDLKALQARGDLDRMLAAKTAVSDA